MILEKKTVGGLPFSDCRTYSKAAVVKSVPYWQKDKQEKREFKSSQVHSQFLTGCQDYSVEEGRSSTSSAGKSGLLHGKLTTMMHCKTLRTQKKSFKTLDHAVIS